MNFLVGLGGERSRTTYVVHHLSVTDDTCDEVLDLVVNTANDSNCDDSNACTADACDQVLGCSHTPIEGCATPVPTGSPWGAILLVTLLLATTMVTFRRRRPWLTG